MTNGGWRDFNGEQRKTAVIAATGFAALVVLAIVANAESTLSKLKAANETVPPHLVWCWEWTSILAWLSLLPILWWVTGRFRSAGLPWPAIAFIAIAGGIAASMWHIGLMVVLRHSYYSVTGSGSYQFFGAIADPVTYEFRKDVVSLIQFVAIFGVVRWILNRQADQPIMQPEPLAPRQLVIAQGAARVAIPVDEIEQVSAAGNYVEVDWAGRKLLHRATLSAAEDALGDTFIRIHRKSLVRADAIRRVILDRSGNFVVELVSGTEVRGSRRYRPQIRPWCQ